MTLAYLSLGSNLGARLDTLAMAVRSTAALPDTALYQVSSVYETAPWGMTNQPPFLNIAIAVQTQLDPFALMQGALQIEQRLGRVRTERWGPRTIDIDLLLYGDTHVTEPDLSIPHPRMTERAFVLIPLLELNEALQVGGRSLAAYLADLPEQRAVRMLAADAFLRLIQR